MAQFIFKRGLSDNFVLKLNQEWKDKNSIWYQATVDKDVFIAIRDEYINIYYKGNSLFKIENNVNAIKYSTHYKYLLDTELKETYVNLNSISKLNITTKIPGLEKIKKASNPHSGIEKEGVHAIIKSKGNDNIIDVELAFTNNEDDKNSRLDFAAFSLAEDGVLELNLYEAKDYSNNELRSRGEPKVIAQLAKYETIIRKHNKEIKDSYELIIRNLKQLEGECFVKWRRVKSNEIRLNPLPLLVIFGFDEDQKNGKFFKGRMKKLSNIGENRLLLKGEPNDFNNGIKSKISIFRESVLIDPIA